MTIIPTGMTITGIIPITITTGTIQIPTIITEITTAIQITTTEIQTIPGKITVVISSKIITGLIIKTLTDPIRTRILTVPVAVIIPGHQETTATGVHPVQVITVPGILAVQDREA